MPQLRPSKIWSTLRDKRLSKSEDIQQKASSGINTLPTELLQEILSMFDFWTLLRCREVCRFWRQRIPGNSPNLRRTMFLFNAPPNATHSDGLALQSFTISLRVHIQGIDDKRLDSQRSRDYVIPTSAGSSLCSRHFDCNIKFNPLLNFNLTRAHLKRCKTAWNHQSLARPLWLTMQVCQPPTQSLTVRLEFYNTRLVLEECIEQSHGFNVTLGNPRGVTLGEMATRIYDAMYWPEMYLGAWWRRQRGVKLLAYKDVDPESWEEWWDEEEGRPEGGRPEGFGLEKQEGKVEEVEDREGEDDGLEQVPIFSGDEDGARISFFRFDWEAEGKM